LEIAVATSSVKFWRRDSVSAGKGAPFDVAIITPHGRPSTKIGTPMEERMPIPRTVAAMTPGASA
jgi:hypothetical protein